MFKRNAKNILIFVIIIQLIIPVAMLLYQADISHNLKKEENYLPAERHLLKVLTDKDFLNKLNV